jgi:Skp family chaperone for outer membrane proteins
MTFTFKSALAATLVASSAFFPSIASAQVAGIATADPLIAIVKAKALGAGYKQIETSYAAYYPQLETKANEIIALQKQLDTNKDNQLSDAEVDAAKKAKNPVLAQIEAKQKESSDLQTPIILARFFVIENITAKYDAALKSVVAAKKINVVMNPNSIVYAPPTIDITQAITDSLDATIPTVPSTPPANWRPTSQNTSEIYQQIAQILEAAARQQQAQQPATPPAAQPQGR